MAVPTRARCPTCHQEVPTAPDQRPKDYPFCSERCRLLDLHRWFAESYRIPVARPPGGGEDGEDEGAAPE